jgi:hypothetical protein
MSDYLLEDRPKRKYSWKNAREFRRKQLVKTILQEAGGDYNKIKTITDNLIKEIESINFPFQKVKKETIEDIVYARKEIERLVDLHKRDRSFFELDVRDSYKGMVKVIKNEIEKLSKQKTNTSIFDFI